MSLALPAAEPETFRRYNESRRRKTMVCRGRNVLCRTGLVARPFRSILRAGLVVLSTGLVVLPQDWQLYSQDRLHYAQDWSLYSKDRLHFTPDGANFGGEKRVFAQKPAFIRYFKTVLPGTSRCFLGAPAVTKTETGKTHHPRSV
jgi:hypothetical protein